jgi:hypothetical protein
MPWACALCMSRQGRIPPPHIDHHTDDLERFLRRLRG